MEDNKIENKSQLEEMIGLKKSKHNRKVRKISRRIRAIYAFFRFLLTVAILYCLYRLALCHYWYFDTKEFLNSQTKKITIVGNSIITNNRIFKEFKNVEIKKLPIYMYNPKQIKDNIEKLPPVKKVYVRRFAFPPRIVIMIDEVTPLLLIAPAENVPCVAMYSTDGKLIGREFLPIPNENAYTKVLTYGIKGDDYTKWDISKIRNLDRLVKNIEHYSKQRVKYIDLRNPHDVYVQIEMYSLRLGELDDTVYKRIKDIPAILQTKQVKEMNKKLKYIDLSWEDTKFLKIDNSNNVDKKE